jgi:rubrerythrin
MTREEAIKCNDLGVDCISRQAVLDLINADWKYENLEIEINNLPSVTPQEPRKGHWIKGYTFPDGAYWKCDKCNELIKVKIPMHYCNNCGADMREVEG